MTDSNTRPFSNPNFTKWRGKIDESKWWEHELDVSREDITVEELNTFILSRIAWYEEDNLVGYALWEGFQADFSGWTTDLFGRAFHFVIDKLRTTLLSRGVNMPRTRQSKLGKLVDVITQETPMLWSDEDIVAFDKAKYKWAPGFTPFVTPTPRPRVGFASLSPNTVGSRQASHQPTPQSTPEERSIRATSFVSTVPETRFMHGQDTLPPPHQTIEVEDVYASTPPAGFHTQVTAIAKLYPTTTRSTAERSTMY